MLLSFHINYFHIFILTILIKFYLNGCYNLFINYLNKTNVVMYLIQEHIMSHATIITPFSPPRPSPKTQHWHPPHNSRNTNCLCWRRRTRTRPKQPLLRPLSICRKQARSKGPSSRRSFSRRKKVLRRSCTQNLSKTRLTCSLAKTATRRDFRPQLPPGGPKDRSWAAPLITHSSLPPPKSLRLLRKRVKKMNRIPKHSPRNQEDWRIRLQTLPLQYGG